MALHGFNDEAWKQHSAEHKDLRAGKRQVHLRKNFTRKGRASSSGSPADPGEIILELELEEEEEPEP